MCLSQQKHDDQQKQNELQDLANFCLNFEGISKNIIARLPFADLCKTLNVNKNLRSFTKESKILDEWNDVDRVFAPLFGSYHAKNRPTYPAGGITFLVRNMKNVTVHINKALAGGVVKFACFGDRKHC